MTALRKNERITVEALRYYVPLFQAGDRAEERLLEEGERLTPGERNHLETLMKLKELSTRKIAALAGPLITRELNKLIAGSHLRRREDLFDLLYYAGLSGMRRGLRRFEVDKLNQSSTNYLFQWIVTYAKKELVVLEAPFGIPPSRFQRYKKVSAVRKKLSEHLGRYATNEEVLDFFLSGRADLKTLTGRVVNQGKPSRANLSMTLELVEEQERFEKEMLSVGLLDPLEDYQADVHLSEHDAPPFNESIFGVFLALHSVTPTAEAVLMSDLQSSALTEEQVGLLQGLTAREYKNVSQQWKNLIKDKEGPFYRFLQEHRHEEFTQFDVGAALRAIEAQEKPVKASTYGNLFLEGKVM